MSDISYPNVFAANTLAQSAQVNANFNAVSNIVNGLLDSTNINPSLGINISLLTGISAVLANPGSLTLPGGLILKWGTVSCPGDGSTSEAVTFGVPFPNAIFVVLPTIQNVFQSNPQGITAQYDTPAVTGFNATALGASSATDVTVAYLALGY